MSKKRKLSAASSTSDMYDDSQLIDQPPSHQTQAKIDPTYGQRSALPCIEDGNDDKESLEALAYLRDVRTEATAIPNLLVAPSSAPSAPQEDNPYGDYPQGYYADGAYTAIPSLPTPSHTSNSSSPADPQEAYYVSLLKRFASVQQNLHSPPPSASPDIRASLLRQRKKAVFWRGKLLKTAPTMRTLGELDQESVIFGLGVLGDVTTLGNLRDQKGGRNLGAWSWGLLGRCRDMGTMGSEDVGVLRDVGKQAGWCLRRFVVEGGSWGGEGDAGGEEDDEELAAIEEEDEHDEKESDENVDERREDDEIVEAERQRLLASIASLQSTDSNGEAEAIRDVGAEARKFNGDGEWGLPNGGETLHAREPEAEYSSPKAPAKAKTPQSEIFATLDAILTIVGEVYGQRDLLDNRLLWDEI